MNPSAPSAGRGNWGVTFFDTADLRQGPGTVKSCWQALAGERNQVVIRYPLVMDEEGKRQAYGHDVSTTIYPGCLVTSLRRLGTDYIDLYQLHPSQWN